MILKGIEILEQDRIPKELKLGEKYHVTWARKGCVWKYTGMDSKDMALLETPRTKKTVRTSIASLRHINKNALKAAKERLKTPKCNLIQK